MTLQNLKTRFGQASRTTTAALAGAGAVLALSLGSWLVAPEAAGPASPATSVAVTTAAPDAPAVDSFAPIVERVAPAVVAVHSERLARAPEPTGFMDDPSFRHFFGDRFEGPPAPQFRQEGLGSGVIVSSDGYILTNHHVIDGADTITVDLNDRRRFDATLVGSDSPSDLAVLKIDARDLPTLVMGDSAAVRVGDVVLAVGDPMGIGQTVTMGIISAKGRATGVGDGSFEDFLQTDAPINQGNSGGALVDTRGELVGINSQILSPTGGNIGIGFAIPSNLARNVMDQLVAHGEVHRGRLGVTIQTVTSDLAASLGLPQVEGALVSGVQPDGPAADAGIRQGDVITAFDGRPVDDGNQLRNLVAQSQPGTKVALELRRDGQTRQVTVTLDELSAKATPRSNGPEPDPLGLGMQVEPLTPELARGYEIERNREGLVVTAVSHAGQASARGFRPGDLIEQADGRPVGTRADLESVLSERTDRPALILVHRRGGSLYLTLDRHRS